jgi:hypothetical protein
MATVKSPRTNGNGPRTNGNLAIASPVVPSVKARFHKTQLHTPAPVAAPAIPAALLALALGDKLGKEMSRIKTQEPLAVGQYPLRGEVVVSVDAVITKERDTEAREAFSCDLLHVLAALCEELGEPPAHVAAHITRAVKIADTGKASKAYLDAVQPALEAVTEEITATLPLHTRKGACRVTGEVSLVSFESF